MALVIPKPTPHPLKDRIKGRITYRQLGDIFGVSEASVSRWLNGLDPIPPAQELGLIALVEVMEAEDQGPETAGSGEAV